LFIGFYSREGLEAQWNPRQQNIVKYVAEAGSMTTGRCMETMNIVRDTAHRDLVKRGIFIRRGLGRGAAYVMREGTFDDEIIR
jgi:predicted HTH transcriptional regulator